MGNTTELRRELKRTFIPFALKQGFVLDQKDAPFHLYFRRVVSDEAHLFEIQWEKYGRPRFVVHFGTCPKDGLVIRDEPIPIERILTTWLAKGGRLKPRHGPSSRSWFRQDKPFYRKIFSSQKLFMGEKVVSRLMELFHELEAYWVEESVGPHLTMNRDGL